MQVFAKLACSPSKSYCSSMQLCMQLHSRQRVSSGSGSTQGQCTRTASCRCTCNATPRPVCAAGPTNADTQQCKAMRSPTVRNPPTNAVNAGYPCTHARSAVELRISSRPPAPHGDIPAGVTRHPHVRRSVHALHAERQAHMWNCCMVVLWPLGRREVGLRMSRPACNLSGKESGGWAATQSLSGCLGDPTADARTRAQPCPMLKPTWGADRKTRKCS